MKCLKLFIIAIVLFIAGNTQAQISVNVNIGTPPMWGPAEHSDVQYYYLPDVEAYYDVNASMFIYLNGSTWVHRRSLPSRYSTYDLYKGYKVVLTDYRGNAPYSHFKDHKFKYAKGFRGPEQRNIGERHEKEKYKLKHSREENSDNEGNSRGNGKNKGDDHGGKHSKKD
ncbi:MAG: hypothetical protein Q8N05_12795 [Bacteroidota bacterium]|nr:hypothetical protein [Bacteroidota bacterium]